MKGYDFNKYLRSKYACNTILLKEKRRIFATDEDVIMALMINTLKSRTRGVTRRLLQRMMEILQIEPLNLKLKRDATNFIRVLKKLAGLQFNYGRTERD